MTNHPTSRRIFHTALIPDRAGFNSVEFMATDQRGTEWAATGKATQQVPNDFTPGTRAKYNPPAGCV